MKIHLATDHAGLELKDHISKFLQDQGYQVVDHGAFSYDLQDDYPDYVKKAALAVAGNSEDRCLIFGGSGQGEAMTANRFKDVRTAVFYGRSLAEKEIDVDGNNSSDSFEIVSLARRHNDANILSLSARFLNKEDAQKAVEVFLKTEFSKEDRHLRRIKKMENHV